MRVEDTLNASWQVFRKHWVSYLIATGIATIGSIFIITAPPLTFGLYYMAIKGLKGDDVEIADVFKGFNYLIVSWTFFIIAAVSVAIGFIFLVIPGLLLIALIQYAIPLIILRNMGATNSIRESINIGRENFTFTILLAITGLVINVIGNTLWIGWIFSMPFTVLCFTKAAIDLSNVADV